MTQVDLFPLWDNFFGPYCIELSCPPRDLRFNKGLISLNAITGRTKFGWLSAFTEEIVFSAPAIEPIDLLDELERRFEVQKRNGGKRRAAVTQFVEEMTRRSREAASVAPGFKDFPVEDLGEGITLESLYPPEELAELRAQGLTDDAILNLTRKQKLELLGIPDHPARMTAQELLNANGIYLKSYEPGERSTTCKECSHTCSRAGQKKKCLSVKIDADGACWHCNHCGWSGPEKGSGSREPKTSNVVQLTNRRANTNANANTAGNVNPAIGPVSYVYHTADGTPAFRKIRAYDKDGNKFFWIERPNGKGGWIKGTKDKDGNRLVDLSILYHLPKVNEAIALEHTILVVEGEKDANRLWSIGIPATCSALGAADLSKNQNPKWTLAHSEQLRGADIVVLGDHDVPGYAHQEVICQLSLGVAKRVRILKLADHWPDCPKGGDVSDYLDTGHTREQLDALIEQAPDYTTTNITPSPVFRDLYESGKPRPSLANAVIAIRALGIVVRYDLFHHRIIVTYKGQSKTIHEGLLTDNTTSAIRSLINNTYQVDCGDSCTLAAIKEIAWTNAYDPVLDMLDECQLKWDGVKRLDTWTTVYLGCENTPLHSAIGRLTLIAACRRARVPGCKFDQIVVQEGPEGKNKSTSIRVLAGDENFSDQSILGASDKEVQEQLDGIWMHENADLAGMRKAEVERVKTFARRQVDRARPAYGHVREDRPRRSIEWGTTSEDTYMVSQTGNRCFWPLKTGKIDIEALKRDRDQLIGEAATCEAVRETIVLDEKLWPDARAAQEQRRITDPWEDLLADIPDTVDITIDETTRTITIVHRSNDGSERVASADLLTYVLNVPKAQQSPLHSQRLAHTMKHLGWSRNETGKVTINDVPVRGYIRNTPEDIPWDP